LCLLVVLTVLPLPMARGDTPAVDGNLCVLGVCLNQFPSKGQTIDSYNWCAEEINKVFGEQSKAFHGRVTTRMVLGKQATHAGVMNALTWLQQTAGTKDLVVMYVGAHGFTDAAQGWGIATADGKTLWGREIKAELGKLPCHAIIMIETCTSGGFASVHKNDVPLPANVTALCACSGRQTTDNQLDMAVAEALYGRADFNKDGVVDLDELIRYIELRYREWWPNPTSTAGSGIPILVKAKSLSGPVPLTRVAPNLVGVVHNGTWYSALNEKRNGTNYQVHMLGWASRPGPYFLSNSAAREFMCLPEDGRPLLVEQDGRWYPARLLNRAGADYRVHYIGYNEQEVVAKSRLFLPFVGDPAHANYPYASTGSAGAWGRLGPAGAWKDTMCGVVLNGRLYTVETSGCLYVTDLTRGTWQQIGKAEFGNTAWMFAAHDSLFTIETDGSLYRVNPKDGSWVRVGPERAWRGTRAGAVLASRLYTVETNGGLYATDLTRGNWQQIGKAEFGNTAQMYAAGDSLFTIERDGTLYRVNPKDGSWVRAGPAGAWKPTQAGTVLKGQLYTVETSGCLYVTALTKGTWQQIGKAEFAGTLGMFATAEKLYTIERDGSLYWVSVK
jgi:hypothetical protein